MANNHMCVSNCFTARTSDKLTVGCFLCDTKFNLKCFNMSVQHAQIFSLSNNAIFMCHKCIDRTNKIKLHSRKSNVTSTAVSMSKNEELARTNSTSTMHNDNDGNGNLSSILSTLLKMDENIKLLNSSNDEFKQRILNSNQVEASDIMNELASINQNIINVHSKIDHSTNVRSKSECSNTSLTIEKLNEILNKAQFSSASAASLANATSINSSLNLRRKSLNVPDPLNWSFSFNQSNLASDK